MYAQQIEVSSNDDLFDRSPPVLEDNLPPGISAEEAQAELNDSGTELKPEPSESLSKINPEMVLFNSRRVDLIEAVQQIPKTVYVDGRRVELKNPARVAAFYEREHYPTIWTQEAQLTGLATQLKQAIADSANDALNPQSYHQDVIDAAQEGVELPDIIALEILMTDAYLTLADHLANGLVDAQALVKTWNALKVEDNELFDLLAEAVNSKDVATTLNGLNASNAVYQIFKAQYINGNQDVDKFALAMERLRWMPQDWGSEYMIVNIPAFEVYMMREGEEIYRTRAVVGRSDRQTPQFVDKLRHVVMSPTWTVPPTILKKDKLKKLRQNPSAFDGNFEVVIGQKTVKPSSVNWNAANAVNYTLRQRPGKQNALGRVKFLFPNKYAIYLHDTPSKSLFNKDIRAYSSGCVRLQKPMDLANILLKGTSWTPARIQAASNKNKEQWANTPQQIPIYLVYWTTWVDSQGEIKSAKDVYKLDEALERAYKKALAK